ncbi:MAG: hypothetical protein H0W08_10995 [Acidobacteria bacterium]|nr:hypothetical protein [Acidobacteriota bacterium]
MIHGDAEKIVLSAGHGREDLLGVSAARRAIAAAAHFARDDGGVPVGPPVGRIEGGIEEDAEDGVVFADQMRSEAPDDDAPTGAREQPPEAVNEVAARQGETMMGKNRLDTGPVSRARLAAPRRRAAQRNDGIVEPQRVTAAQQVRQAALVTGVTELAMEHSAVSLHDAGSIRANSTIHHSGPAPARRRNSSESRRSLSFFAGWTTGHAAVFDTLRHPFAKT